MVRAEARIYPLLGSYIISLMYEGQPDEAEMAALLPDHECLGRWADDLVFRHRRLRP